MHVFTRVSDKEGFSRAPVPTELSSTECEKEPEPHACKPSRDEDGACGADVCGRKNVLAKFGVPLGSEGRARQQHMRMLMADLLARKQGEVDGNEAWRQDQTEAVQEPEEERSQEVGGDEQCEEEEEPENEEQEEEEEHDQKDEEDHDQQEHEEDDEEEEEEAVPPPSTSFVGRLWRWLLGRGAAMEEEEEDDDDDEEEGDADEALDQETAEVEDEGDDEEDQQEDHEENQSEVEGKEADEFHEIQEGESCRPQQEPLHTGAVLPKLLCSLLWGCALLLGCLTGPALAFFVLAAGDAYGLLPPPVMPS